MEKLEFLELLMSELNYLKEKNVLDLAANGRNDEVDAILKEANYSVLEEYMQNDDFENLELSDIPDEDRVIFAIYLYGSKIEDIDVEIMYNWQEFQEDLAEYGEIGEKISANIGQHGLTYFDTFADFMAPCNEDEEH